MYITHTTQHYTMLNVHSTTSLQGTLTSTPLGEGEEITTPHDEVDLPQLLEDLHGVPTKLASEDPPKVSIYARSLHLSTDLLTC